MSLSSRHYTLLADFLKTRSGLTLTPDRGYLLESRLQPIAVQYNLGSVGALAEAIGRPGTAPLQQDVVEAMTTNETSFFRDGTPFEILRNHVLPRVAERRKSARTLRILCAAASSGQEPYSIAMILAEAATRFAGWSLQITGLDIDAKILSKATRGIYSQFEVQRGLPVSMLMKYFQQLPDQTWQIKSEIRRMVQFTRRNLVEPFEDLGKFDIIFCRNVLIYFDLPRKRDVLNRLAQHVSPDGYLFLGGAETVLEITDAFVAEPGCRGVYVPAAAARKLRAAG